MKQSIKITAFVICSLIIVLALVGSIFSILSIVQYEKIVNAHNADDAWFETEEYDYINLMEEAHGIQWIHTLGVIISAVALMTAVLCLLRLPYEVNPPKLVPMPLADGNPKYWEYKFMSKTLLIVQIPIEIVSICLGIAIYFIIQFVTISNDKFILLVLPLILEFLGFPMFALNLLALTWQFKTTQSVPLYKTGL